MRVIAPSTTRKWCDEHPRAKERLLAWLDIVKRAKWSHPPSMLKQFPKADPVKVKSGKPNVYVFNILGNEYRLICAVHFKTGIVFTLRFMKHNEYERGSLEKRAMKRANKANPFPHGIPRTFAELVAIFAPRVIHDRMEFENASAVMNAMAGHALNKEQDDYLETLAILVDEYDRGHNRQPEKSSPLAVLHLLMEEHDLSGRDLGRILGNQAAGGFILRGERSITVEQAKKLGERFSVDPVVFLGL